MSNIIDKIQLSGTNYDIQDSNATRVVEITQSEYDALPSSAKTSNTFFVITDAEVFNISGFVQTSAVTTSVTSTSTDAQIPTAKAVYNALGSGGGITSGDVQTMITQAVSGKTDTTAFTTHTASTVHMNDTEKTNLDSLATNIAAISGITSTKVSNWDGAVTNASNAITRLGGLTLVKITQSAYDALTTKDSNTLYVING